MPPRVNTKFNPDAVESIELSPARSLSGTFSPPRRGRGVPQPPLDSSSDSEDDASGAMSASGIDAMLGPPRPSPEPLASRLLNEFIGTVMLVFTVVMSRGNAIAIGAALMCMVFIGGHISGGHYNPAVTVAAAVRGNIGADAFFYVLVQVLGGIVGAISAALAANRTAYPRAGEGYGVAAVIIAETIHTSALGFVVLNTATVSPFFKKKAGQAVNSFFGLAIGFSVLAGAIAISNVSGGVMNPAIGIGALLGHYMYQDVAAAASADNSTLTIDGMAIGMSIYLCTGIIGGVLAGLLFRVTSRDEFVFGQNKMNDNVNAAEEDEAAWDRNPFLAYASPLAMESWGTFMLVFTVYNAVSVPGNLLAPLGIGSMLMCVIFSGGHVSGGHYNPAVTVAIFLRGAIGMKKAVMYILVQVVSGYLAALVARYGVQTDSDAVVDIKPGADVNMATAIGMEIMYTFALCSAVLNTASRGPDNSYFGLAIGFTVVAGAHSVGDVSGGAFNPAVGTALVLAGSSLSVTNLAIYWIGPTVGGVLAFVIFRATHIKELAAEKRNKVADERVSEDAITVDTSAAKPQDVSRELSALRLALAQQEKLIQSHFSGASNANVLKELTAIKSMLAAMGRSGEASTIGDGKTSPKARGSPKAAAGKGRYR